MTVLDDELLPAIAELINDEVGTDVTFYVATGRGVDHSTGAVVGERDTATTVKATPPVIRRVANEDGTESRSCSFLIAGQGLTFEPKRNQRVVIGGEDWKVVKRDPIRSGDSVVAWKLMLD